MMTRPACPRDEKVIEKKITVRMKITQNGDSRPPVPATTAPTEAVTTSAQR